MLEKGKIQMFHLAQRRKQLGKYEKNSRIMKERLWWPYLRTVHNVSNIIKCLFSEFITVYC